MERSRQPSGIPTGGQFARETKRRGDTDSAKQRIRYHDGQRVADGFLYKSSAGRWYLCPLNRYADAWPIGEAMENSRRFGYRTAREAVDAGVITF